MAKRKVRATKLVVGLPFSLGQLEMEPDEAQQKVAWELYVELSTRIAVQPAGDNEGSIREALSSLYSIVEATREILREAGPTVAQGPNSVGALAIEVVNRGLRPFLTKWHPLLQAHEDRRSPEVHALDHERAWNQASEFRQELVKLQGQMAIYVESLASIAGMKTNDHK